MGASGGGEKGKEVSGDTGAGLRAGNELGPTVTLPPLQAPQPRAEKRTKRIIFALLIWPSLKNLIKRISS